MLKFCLHQNVKDYKRGQGETAVKAVTFIEGKHMFANHNAAYMTWLTTMFQLGFSQTCHIQSPPLKNKKLKGGNIILSLCLQIQTMVFNQKICV